MECNMKGHRQDGNVFGMVYPTFQTAKRKGKFRETEEARRKLGELTEANTSPDEREKGKPHRSGNQQGRGGETPAGTWYL